MKKRQKPLRDRVIKKAKSDRKTKSILIRLSEAKYNALKDLCEKHDIGTQKVIEDLIDHFIDGTL